VGWMQRYKTSFYHPLKLVSKKAISAAIAMQVEVVSAFSVCFSCLAHFLSMQAGVFED